MIPHPLPIAGTTVAVWNLAFLAAAVAGYFVFRRSVPTPAKVPFLFVRYLWIVYASALAAQIFAYAFDANTTLRPPPGTSVANYYLNPLAGPKTLYGVIVMLPPVAAIAALGSTVSLRRWLVMTTPALLVVLAIVRLGCFLQGCCYGQLSSTLGVQFPVGSPAYYDQIQAGLIQAGAIPLPVMPTQVFESAFLATLALWSIPRAQLGEVEVFLRAVASYSIFRFFIEFVRADAERGFYGALSTSQWIAVVVLGLSLLAFRLSHQPRETAT